MSLDVITAGGGLEETFFWVFGLVILGIGLLDTILTPKDKDYED